MEFQIRTDLAVIPKTIEFNFVEIKKELAGNLEKYQNMVVTEDAIKDAKADRAKLNKLKEAIEKKRKEIKAECLAPYNAFEKQVKEIVSMIEAPMLAIDGQIKEFEAARKAEKMEEIGAYYKANAADIIDLVSFERIFDPKWLNATASMKSIEEEIDKTVTRISGDITIIKSMALECESAVLSRYIATLDMSEAMAEKTRFEDEQKRIEEFTERQKARQAARAASQKLEEVKKEALDVEYEEVKPDVKTIKVVFYDTTPEFRAEMKALTEKHNIRYGGIK